MAAALLACRTPEPLPPPRRLRWDTPDDDFIDADLWLPRAAAPRAAVVLFHGLEGSSRSHYAQALAWVALRRGWALIVPHFRGCSGEPNRAPRAYHSGDHAEIDGMLRQAARALAGVPLRAVGVSLGGNALLRWLQEHGDHAGAVVQAAAAVSAPLDLAAAGAAIDRGLNRWLYARHFLRTMRAKAAAFARAHPGRIDAARAMRARTLRAFDDAFTAPLHGFAGVDDYWQRASSRPHLARIAVPTLVLNARNDPFVPAASLPTPEEVGPWVRLWQPAQGGHVGFAEPRFRGDPRGQVWGVWEHVSDWLQAAAALR
ncbi:alpha/beta hydrolase fold protein [Tepidimonas sediminis]|uniref:Alpha/beta hydrolase fold protein n=1 Tax=Tepidimonas sediminis TaxID=2588941 RepID=A0A554WL51_9BURK|nr:alpha/beta fold hydrolase [Tepidimonas sediminis]TSE24321.1 alpha/beta hydrolase fold protein [Tepidimonas sediminis]